LRFNTQKKKRAKKRCKAQKSCHTVVTFREREKRKKKLKRNYSPTKYFKNKRFRGLVNDKKVRKEKLLGAQKKGSEKNQ